MPPYQDSYSMPLSQDELARAEAISRLSQSQAGRALLQAIELIRQRKARQQEQQEAIRLQQEQMKAEEEAQRNALVSQIVGPLATMGGLYAANRWLSPAETVAAETSNQLASEGLRQAATETLTKPDIISTALGSPSSAEGAFTLASGGTIPANTPVASAIGGGELLADGSIAAAPSGWSLGNIGAAGNYVLPAAGALGAIDLFANQRSGGRGAAQGALSGAALGSYFGLPGAGIGALIGGGLGYFGDLGDKDRWKTEQDRRAKLSGVTGWDALNSTMPQLTKGRSPDELYQIEMDKASKGQWSNPTFAKSRNVADLKPEDIWGYSAFGEKFGNDWLGKFNEGQRKQIAQTLLDKGAISEGKGTINIKWTPELEEEVKRLTQPQQPVRR